MNLLAGISVYVYTIFSILALPSVTPRVQIIIGCLLLLGLLVNIMKAGRSNEFLINRAKKDICVEDEKTTCILK
jgi:chromate transport protein ChrA